MRNREHEAAMWEADYDKAMNDVMGLSELIGERNGELNDLNYIISNALGHIDDFPGDPDGDFKIWLQTLKDILNGITTL